MNLLNRMSPAKHGRKRRVTLYPLLGLFAVSLCLVQPAQAGEKKRTPRRVARSTTDSSKPNHPLASYIRMAKESRVSLKKVHDFEAVFRKMEVVKGKRFSNTMSMKFRKKPFSVYLRFHKPHQGREVLYVDGKNNGNLLAHDSGFRAIAGTLALSPTGERAMREGRYPITRIGPFKLLDALIAQWENELRYDSIKVKFYPNARLYLPREKLKLIECKVLESSHSRFRRGLQFQLTRLYLDKKTNLPVRLEQYGFPLRRGGKAPLLEEYTYWNLKTNVGWKDLDFDPKNPNYKF